jgi:hypothetical protein
MHEDFSKSTVFCGARALTGVFAYSLNANRARLHIRSSNQQGGVLLNSVSPAQRKERISNDLTILCQFWSTSLRAFRSADRTFN